MGSLSTVTNSRLAGPGADIGNAAKSPFALLLGLGTFVDWVSFDENSLSWRVEANSDWYDDGDGGNKDYPDGLKETMMFSETEQKKRISSRINSSHGRCFGTGLKIFLHGTDNYESGGLFCSAGQWGVEVILHRYLMRSSCRTLHPHEADLFWVPDYRACHWHLTPKKGGGQGLTTKPNGDVHSIVIANHKDKVRDIQNADKVFQKLLEKLSPWFARHHGVDHVFTFSDQGFIVNFTHTFPSWREHIHASIFLTTEAFTPGHGPSCFSPWKDFVIPGHLDPYRMEEIRRFNKPSANRTLLFSFHGRTASNHPYYVDVKVRSDIERFFKGKPRTSIGDFTASYFEIIGNSHFCLIPEGTSSWTNHLYTSFFAGCIPIILSDKFVLPFQKHINWARLSVRWPQDKLSNSLYEWVRLYVEMQFDDLVRTKGLIDKHQCWFDWYDFEKITDCSPYKAIFESLASRRPPPYKSKFGWLGNEADSNFFDDSGV